MLKRIFRFSCFRLGLLITLVFCSLKLPVCGISESHALRFLQNVENTWLDTKFRLRGGPETEAERKEFQKNAHVVIAAIDEKSFRREDLGMWPWPRSKIATLIEQLNRCDAKVIGFDVVFSEPDSTRTGPLVAKIKERYSHAKKKDEQFEVALDEIMAAADGDQVFAKVLEDTENVVLGYFFFNSEEEVKAVDPADLMAGKESIGFGTISYTLGYKGADRNDLSKAFPVALGVRANLPLLSEAAEIYGYFNQMPDEDRIYRQVPMVWSFDNQSYPSLTLQVLSTYYDQPVELLIQTFTGEEHIKEYIGLFIGPLERPGENHLEIPLNRGGRFQVNFYGKQRSFLHVSAGDIIHGESEACAAVKDKVVLVGATSIGVYDLRPMPFESDFPGVEIHASVIENVINKDFLVRPPMYLAYEALVMLLLGLILTWFLSRFRLTVGLVVSLLALLGVVATDFFFMFGNGLMAYVVVPVLHLVVLFAGIAVYRYATEEREKAKIRHAFQFYLSKDVINDVLEDTTRLKLGGERRVLTVLFSDIRGFTTISEKLDPEDLSNLLNEYLTPMTEIVFKHAGTLDKYIGDAVMALYGAPVPFDDHPHAACRTALEMMEELGRLRKGWAERGLPDMDIGIGLNTGLMSVGNMGSATRFDYTVMGDQVNLGARLEGLNKNYGTHIIISEFTRAAVGDHFTCRELDAVQVKGKNEPVTIFELLHKGPPNPEQDAWIKEFHQAFRLYKDQQWDQAMAAFSGMQDDSVAKMYLKRCQEMKQNPPGEGWDGVFKMTTK